MPKDASQPNDMYEPYSCLISLYYDETPDYLHDCIESILAQTIIPEEIVIVKDGPLPIELQTILDEYACKYPRLFTFLSYEVNKGLWYALSVGVPACRNELIMRMDVDDWSSPDRAEKELDIFKQHPEVGCVGSLATEFYGSIDNAISIVKLPENHNDILRFGKRRCPFRHPSLMYRKSAVLLAGSYQEMPLFEDYDLYMRLASSGCRFYNIQESLVYMRISPSFFERRGSIEYMKKMIKFKYTCLKRGDYNFLEYLISTIPHIVVCLIPNRMRTFVYMHLLRAPAPSELSRQ